MFVITFLMLSLVFGIYVRVYIVLKMSTVGIVQLVLFIIAVPIRCCWSGGEYTQTQGLWPLGLWFIGNYALKCQWTIFHIDSNVILPNYTDFLYLFFFGEFDLTMSKISIFRVKMAIFPQLSNWWPYCGWYHFWETHLYKQL